MTKILQIWKCNICGNIVELVHPGSDSLVCCGQPMELQQEKTQKQEGKEKHVPVIYMNKVRIGSIPHPMEPEHYIEWIEATDEKGMKTKVFLKPGYIPEVEFCFNPVKARAYCNVHGLWTN